MVNFARTSRDELMRRGLAAQRVLRGESASDVAAEYQVSIEELEQWRRYYLGDRRGSRHTVKRIVARWPVLDLMMRRAWYFWQIRRGRFHSDEPEFEALDQLVKPGDWVLDIGANIGTFTRRLSELVGQNGRVLAFEPIGSTFSLLVANVADLMNVTLCNMAASDEWREVHMVVPKFGSGLLSYANATIVAQGTGLPVLAVALDTFELPHKIALIKLDAEGHEPEVLRGIRKLIGRDGPTLIVEFNTPETGKLLEEMGYSMQTLSNGAQVARPG